MILHWVIILIAFGVPGAAFEQRTVFTEDRIEQAPPTTVPPTPFDEDDIFNRGSRRRREN
jgi:hypothetical protein